MTALLAVLLAAPAARADELALEAGMPQLEEAAGAYLDGYLDVSHLTGDSFADGLSAILSGSGGTFSAALGQAGRSGVMLLGVALLCALADTVGGTFSPGALEPVRLAGTAAVTAIAAADVHALMGLGREALTRMGEFSRLLLPVVTALSAAAGSPTASVVRQSATLLFLDLLLTLSQTLVLPLVYAYTAAWAAHAALGNDGLKRLAGLIKWLATGLLTALVTGFVLYLSVTGAVAGSADALAQKAAKTMLSGMVPVVGGILSDAAETVVAGAGILKGTAGVMGLLCVLCICLGPFLRLGCHYLVYKLTAAVTATVCAGPVASLIDAMVGAFAMVMGLVGGGGLILYVALITSMKAVVG